jgi:hypothetical protein
VQPATYERAGRLARVQLVGFGSNPAQNRRRARVHVAKGTQSNRREDPAALLDPSGSGAHLRTVGPHGTRRPIAHYGAVAQRAVRDRGHREVEVGPPDEPRRTDGKVAIAVGAARSRLRVGQFGVVSGGAHRAVSRVHGAVRAGLHVLSFDMRNAFNEIHRDEVLRHVPECAARPLIRALYQGPCEMITPGGAIRVQCTRGVVQGCPLAASLFANALMRGPVAATVEELAEWLPVVSLPPSCAPSDQRNPPRPFPRMAGVGHVWYADDGHAASDDLYALDRYGQTLQRHLLHAGLLLAVGPAKTSLLAASPDEPLPEWLAGAASPVSVLHCLGAR